MLQVLHIFISFKDIGLEFEIILVHIFNYACCQSNIKQAVWDGDYGIRVTSIVIVLTVQFSLLTINQKLYCLPLFHQNFMGEKIIGSRSGSLLTAHLHLELV